MAAAMCGMLPPTLGLGQWAVMLWGHGGTTQLMKLETGKLGQSKFGNHLFLSAACMLNIMILHAQDL